MKLFCLQKVSLNHLNTSGPVDLGGKSILDKTKWCVKNDKTEDCVGVCDVMCL